MTLDAMEKLSPVDRIGESDYARDYHRLVLPFWSQGRTAMLKGHDGLEIHSWHRRHPAARAQIFLSHGYAENTLKYRELAFTFFQNGYSVYVWDHRGHGFSARTGPEKHSVDVQDFADYAKDLHAVMQELPQDAALPNFLFGHSLGGAIAIDFMQRYPDRIQAAVLSSPLLIARLRGLPPGLAIALARILARLHAPDRCTLGGPQTAAEFWSFKLAGTRSRSRFEQFQKESLAADLRMTGPTNRWVISTLTGAKALLNQERMAKLRMPLLVATAGRDRLVRADAIATFCQKAPRAEPRFYDQSHHEIWNERDGIRNTYLDDVLSFYQRWETR